MPPLKTGFEQDSQTRQLAIEASKSTCLSPSDCLLPSGLTLTSRLEFDSQEAQLRLLSGIAASALTHQHNLSSKFLSCALPGRFQSSKHFSKPPPGVLEFSRAIRSRLSSYQIQVIKLNESRVTGDETVRRAAANVE